MEINENNSFSENLQIYYTLGQREATFLDFFFQVFYHSIDSIFTWNKRYAPVQCSTAFKRPIFTAECYLGWEARLACLICVKERAVFWVLHHNTYNFNIHSSLAVVPYHTPLPPFFCLSPHSLSQPLSFAPPSFCSFPYIAALESHPCCQTVCPLQCWMGTSEGSVSPLRKRLLISHTERSINSAQREKLQNTAWRGGRWDRTLFWSILASFNLLIKVG